MSNYPPGVSGNEYEIAGADFEQDEIRDVAECENVQCNDEWMGPLTVEGVVAGYGAERWFNWECPVCGTRNTDDLPDEEFERDPDEGRDD